MCTKRWWALRTVCWPRHWKPREQRWQSISEARSMRCTPRSRNNVNWSGTIHALVLGTTTAMLEVPQKADLSCHSQDCFYFSFQQVLGHQANIGILWKPSSDFTNVYLCIRCTVILLSMWNHLIVIFLRIKGFLSVLGCSHTSLHPFSWTHTTTYPYNPAGTVLIVRYFHTVSPHTALMKCITVSTQLKYIREL